MFGKKDEELQIGKQEKNNKKKERVRNREIVIVTCFFSLLMLVKTVSGFTVFINESVYR